MPAIVPPPELARALSRPFKHIVVFSGAGMSAESGIPTFRSGSGGLWQDASLQALATPGGFRRDPDLVWGWYEWRRGLVQQALPNAGHLAVGRLQRELGATVVTQNVDDLHERGGAAEVLHLHGSILAPRCFACGRPHPFTQPAPATEVRIPPPRCTHCKGRVRPGVVWFGEELPREVVRKATQALAVCDFLLVIGTSRIVQPAAGMVDMVPPSCTVIVVNPDAESAARTGELHWQATAADALPCLADTLMGFAD